MYGNKVQQARCMQMSLHTVSTVTSHKLRAVHSSSFAFIKLVLPWIDDSVGSLRGTKIYFDGGAVVNGYPHLPESKEFNSRPAYRTEQQFSSYI